MIAASFAHGFSGQALRERFLLPHLAFAQAMTGDVAAARATLQPLAADCDFCLRSRAQVEGLARNWAEADRLFAALSARGPSIPFTWAAWGETRLARGDAPGAERDARRALKAGPHYADASDLLGRALAAQGKTSEGAKAFRAAILDAPRWGGARLRLAQALTRAGDFAGARGERDAALAMDLTPTERQAATARRL